MLAPLRVIYITESGKGVQAGFTAGSRHFRKATDRNRIKRLLRESFRLHQSILNEATSGLKLSVFFVYANNDLPDQQELHLKMKAVLQKLQSIIHEATPLHS